MGLRQLGLLAGQLGNNQCSYPAAVAPIQENRAQAEMMRVHFSSKSDNWTTPTDLIAKIHAAHPLHIDAAAWRHNAATQHFITPLDDALDIDWHALWSPFFGPRVKLHAWLNPPYSQIAEFLAAAVRNSAKMSVTCLIPARTDTRWWHDYVRQGDTLLIKGRLRFGGATSSAPFPSAIVRYGPGTTADAVGYWDCRNESYHRPEPPF